MNIILANPTLNAAFPPDAVGHLDERLRKGSVVLPEVVSTPAELKNLLRTVRFFEDDYLQFNLGINDKLAETPESIELFVKEVWTKDAFVDLVVPTLFSEFSSDGLTVTAEELRFGVLAYHTSTAKVYALRFLAFARLYAPGQTARQPTLTKEQIKDFYLLSYRRQLKEALLMAGFLWDVNDPGLWANIGLDKLFQRYLDKCHKILSGRMDHDIYPLFLQQKGGGDPETTTLEEYVRIRTGPGNLSAMVALGDRLCALANAKFQTKQKEAIQLYFHQKSAAQRYKRDSL